MGDRKGRGPVLLLERLASFGPESFSGIRMASDAYEYALNLLSARAYTVRNLRVKLTQRDFETPEIDSAIARLIARHAQLRVIRFRIHVTLTYLNEKR